MSLQLFFHPFSSYSQKALIALYENGTPFTPRVLSQDDPATGAEFARRWPLQRLTQTPHDFFSSRAPARPRNRLRH